MSSPEITPPRSTQSVLETVARVILFFLKLIPSLKLTCALFVLAVLLIFFGTLAQKGIGIWTVVEQYFWSWFVRVEAQHLARGQMLDAAFPRQRCVCRLGAKLDDKGFIAWQRG